MRSLDPMRLALRMLRERRGLSQQELADKSGVSKARISGYETGPAQPTFDTLERLLQALESSRLALFLLAELLEPAAAFLGAAGDDLRPPASAQASAPVIGALRLNLQASSKLVDALEQNLLDPPSPGDLSGR